MTTYRKKLIEVALPLDAINAASAREKSIRHGHPSTLHLWWARRPLAAARAVIFAQMADDPSRFQCGGPWRDSWPAPSRLSTLPTCSAPLPLDFVCLLVLLVTASRPAFLLWPAQPRYALRLRSLYPLACLLGKAWPIIARRDPSCERGRFQTDPLPVFAVPISRAKAAWVGHFSLRNRRNSKRIAFVSTIRAR